MENLGVWLLSTLNSLLVSKPQYVPTIMNTFSKTFLFFDWMWRPAKGHLFCSFPVDGLKGDFILHFSQASCTSGSVCLVMSKSCFETLVPLREPRVHLSEKQQTTTSVHMIHSRNHTVKGFGQHLTLLPIFCFPKGGNRILWFEDYRECLAYILSWQKVFITIHQHIVFLFMKWLMLRYSEEAWIKNIYQF